MRKRNLLFIVFVFLISVTLSKPALAGFGISPPYVKNDNLARGSVYQKTIIITRGDPNEDLKAEIAIDVPGANDWITIDRGKEFILPKGENKVPITITVKIPKDASYGVYKGGIKIKTSSLEAIQKGTVSIALGAYIDVNLNITKAKIFDFLIRGMRMLDTEEGFAKWIFHFPTKIKAELQLENLGNIKCHPTKVLIDIYDENKINRLRTLEAKQMTSVKPFETGSVFITFLTDLKPGSYYIHYQIYKNQEIAQGGEGDLHLSIVPHGTINNYQGATIFDLSIKEKLIIFIPFVVILGLFGFIIFKLIKKFLKK